MFRFTIRELVLLTLVVAMGVGWWIERGQLNGEVSKLRRDVKRLAAGPDWAGMDRIMDEHYQHWRTLQTKEREMGLEPTPLPSELFSSELPSIVE